MWSAYLVYQIRSIRTSPAYTRSWPQCSHLESLTRRNQPVLCSVRATSPRLILRDLDGQTSTLDKTRLTLTCLDKSWGSQTAPFSSSTSKKWTWARGKSLTLVLPSSLCFTNLVQPSISLKASTRCQSTAVLCLNNSSQKRERRAESHVIFSNHSSSRAQ